ncbi:MAG: GNAT family N-acetyltransferase [Oscillospiraceae bacterium]|nr:GNAT family N-acetyltransferase [Oscillospiraceae bacterium]
MLIQKEELTIRSLTPDENYMQLVIEVGDKAIGEMNCHNMGCKTAQISIEIHDPALRDKGYGTRFLSMLIEELFMNLGYERIILDVDLDNHRARHIYEKLGFKVTGIKEESNVADYELTKENYL